MSRAESSRIEGAPGAGAAAVTAAGPGHYRLDSNARAFLKYVGGMAAALAPLAIAYGDYYWLNILTYTYLFAGLAASWNIIGGFGGQFSLGHGVFFAIGAYFTAIFYADHGISPWLTILPAALVSAAVASLISWPTFRLKGPFFAIATMAFNEVAMVFANYFSGVTGGPRGILIPFKAGFTNMIFAERWKYAVLMFAYAALVVGLSVVIRRNRLGYYLLAVREDEDAARAAGINTTAVKIQGMAISASLTAIGGGLFAMFLRFVDPPSLFTLPEIGVKFALVALIGGLGTISGPVLGAFLFIPVENYLRGSLGGLWPGAHLIVLSIILVLAALFLKRGIVGAVGRLYSRLSRERRNT